jgi:hypothetical protein
VAEVYFETTGGPSHVDERRIIEHDASTVVSRAREAREADAPRHGRWRTRRARVRRGAPFRRLPPVVRVRVVEREDQAKQKVRPPPDPRCAHGCAHLAARPRHARSTPRPRVPHPPPHFRPRRRRLESLLTRTSASGAVAGAVRGASAASGLASRRADPRADEAHLADAEAPDAEHDVDVGVDVVVASEADARDAAGVRTGDDPARRVRRVIGELDEMQKRYDAVFRAVAADDGTAGGTPTRL